MVQRMNVLAVWWLDWESNGHSISGPFRNVTVLDHSIMGLSDIQMYSMFWKSWYQWFCPKWSSETYLLSVLFTLAVLPLGYTKQNLLNLKRIVKLNFNIFILQFTKIKKTSLDKAGQFSFHFQVRPRKRIISSKVTKVACSKL